MGTPVTVTGEITVMYSDDFVSKRAELMHVIRDEQTGRSIRLRFQAGASPGLRSGMHATIRGRAANGEVYVAALDPTGESSIQVVGTSQETVASGTGPVVGDQQTLVIVTNFSDKALNPLVPGY